MMKIVPMSHDWGLFFCSITVIVNNSVTYA